MDGEAVFVSSMRGKDEVLRDPTKCPSFSPSYSATLTPPAPSEPEEIRQALADGMEMEEGALVVRVEGISANRRVRIDNYVNSPGLTEAFEKHGITHESFQTGQLAFLFTKLFVEGKITTPGMYPPEMLSAEVRSHYLAQAAKIGITVDEIASTRLY